MISPGCSFTFSGLKQTLLALEPGIEKKVKEVEHLVVNYRTTKDILIAGNAILSAARKFFPGAIDFARPERARKDLGLKVALCSWNAAFDSKVKFGSNQAFVYSSHNEPEICLMADQWLDGHPFILSSLQSKGLEFDDVVVAFDHERKTWQLERGLEQSLTVLRELYVAVTRAQQRVVILVKGSCPAMKDFLSSLQCDFEEVNGSVFEEFDRDTSPEVWFDKATNLLGMSKNEVAAKCFTRAKRQDWSCLAQGRHFLGLGLLWEAEKQFRRAARVFYENRELEQIVLILRELLKHTPGDAWDKSDDDIFVNAISDFQDCIPRIEVVRYSILRGDVRSVTVTDLKDRAVCSLLHEYRGTDWLKQLVADCTESDREDLELTVPDVVADFHFDQSSYHEACRVSLSSRLLEYADKSTTAFLAEAKLPHHSEGVLKLAHLWHELGPVAGVLPIENSSMLFSELFRSPRKLQSGLKTKCLEVLGQDLILLAVDSCKLDRVTLLEFSAQVFREEVDASLLVRFGSDLEHVVAWYNNHGYSTLASDFAERRRAVWSNERLIFFIKDFKTKHRWLFEELRERKLLDMSVALTFLSPFVSEDNKLQIASDLSGFRCQLLEAKPKNKTCSKKEPEVERISKACDRNLGRILAALTTNSLLVEKTLLYVFLNCDRMAVVESSMEAIGTRELANQNLIRVFTLWTSMGQLRESALPTIRSDTPEEKFLFLMRLFFCLDPMQECLRVFLELDSVATIANLFGPSVAAYCLVHNSTGSGGQDENLLERLVDFHAELKSVVLSESTPAGLANSIKQRNSKNITGLDEAVEGTLQNSSVDAEASCTTQTMSKKAARKQKQNGKSNGKKQKPKRNNNKKKNKRR